MIELFFNLTNLLRTHFWVCLLVPLPLIYLYTTRNFNYWKKRGINGPKAYPFIGNTISLLTPIPHLYTEYLRKYGKFFGAFRGNRPMLFISEPEVIKRILVRDFPLFRNRAAQGGMSKVAQYNLVNARDMRWRRIRSILTPMFTSSKLRKLEQTMRSCTQTMVEAFERHTAESPREGITVMAKDEMGKFTMNVIAKGAFGTETNAHDKEDNIFVRNAKEMLTFSLTRILLIPLMPNSLYRLLRKWKLPFFYNPSSDFFLNLSKHLIEERRSVKGSTTHDDMLQQMVNAEFNEKTYEKDVYEKEDLLEAHHVNSGTEEMEAEKKLLKDIVGTKTLNEDEIIAQAMVFFLAGYETTASSLSFCLYELAVNPDIQEKLHQEIENAKGKDPTLSYQTLQSLPYLDAVLSETLRKYPPALSLGRECAAEEYHIPEINFTLKKGSAVTFPVYAIHHSPEFWPEPELFNPERFLPENRFKIVPYTYLPFGGGPRNCIGMRFALTEAKIGLASIIDRFEIFRTKKTADKLKILFSFPLLKTEPIYIGVRRR